MRGRLNIKNKHQLEITLEEYDILKSQAVGILAPVPNLQELRKLAGSNEKDFLNLFGTVAK